MKRADIHVGGTYLANVSGKRVTVRVDQMPGLDGRGYKVTNLITGRKTVFRSSQRFLQEVDPDSPAPKVRRQLRKEAMDYATKLASVPPAAGNVNWAGTDEEDEQRPDPLAPPSNGTGTTTETNGAGVLVAERGETPLASLLRRSIEERTETLDGSPHLIVEARAGTGKTTTLIGALQVLMGKTPTTIKHLPTGKVEVGIEPSPQQRAVWDAVALSKGKVKAVCFVAFNKSIAEELKTRVPQGCEAMTMHSMGLKAVTKALGRLEINSYVVQDLIAEITETDLRELRREDPTLLRATEDLVSLCKMNLSDGSPEELDRLAAHYDVDLNGSRSKVFDLVPKVLERCKTPKGRINFDDMIWLPVALNLPVFRYDLLLVDEAQDLNRCQQALAKKAGKRLVLCGDPKQAIYGFAGADAESMPRMARELSGRDAVIALARDMDGDELSHFMKGALDVPRCITLPLTVTRRCGKAIVEEARKIVPDFEAHESNPEGVISIARYPERGKVVEEKDDYANQVQDGDMCLCRVNAPLVSQCFRFLKSGRKANIQGRDIGQGLISTIRKLTKKDDATPVATLIAALDDWYHAESQKENSKRQPNENRLIALGDRRDCLACFCDGAQTSGDVIRKIEQVFTDDKTSPGIKLSSIHKAKGLEARRVFFLQPKGAECPHPMARSAWQREQEMNLRYVAITRAIEELVYVS